MNYDGIREDKYHARGGYDADDDSNFTIQKIVREVVVSTKEEIMG